MNVALLFEKAKTDASLRIGSLTVPEVEATSAAVAELVEATRWLQRLRANGYSPRIEEASDRVDAALAKFGEQK